MKPPADSPPQDALLILGGECGAGMHRTRLALACYQRRIAAGAPPPFILASGANPQQRHGRQRRECEHMRSYLIGSGVRPEHILIEQQARDTYANIILGSSLARRHGIGRLCIVTDRIHGWRAARLYTLVHGHAPADMLLAPVPGRAGWGRYLREALAYCALRLDLLLASVPCGSLSQHRRYLFDSHPLHGSKARPGFYRSLIQLWRKTRPARQPGQA